LKYRVLLVDDSQLFLDLTKKFLEENGMEVRTAISGEQAIQIARSDRQGFSLIVLDYLMGNRDGATTAREILAEFPDQYIVICSSDTSRGALQESWKAGAVEFIDKSNPPDAFLATIRAWCKKQQEKRPAFFPVATNAMKEIAAIGLIGSSPGMAKVAELVKNYRNQKSTVLILGETGTGKERIAKALAADDRHPFRAVNCAAYNGDTSLLESELFGIEKGSFTGATHDKKGIFEEVGHGIVFLDEIHALSFRAQQKLLRVLQERTVRPVGSTREYKVHFRLVAAAKANLEQLVSEGEFLLDLYHRLDVLRIDVPPLRERPEEIGLLAAHFSAVHSVDPNRPKKFMGRTVSVLGHYSWPGNVRELENMVERLCATVVGEMIRPEDLGAKFFEASGGKQTNNVNAFRRQMESMTREMVMRALQESKSQRDAARRLGVPKSSFHDLLRRFGLDGAKRGRKSNAAGSRK
jgi:DNA-binding NtrC family response regulator